MRETFEIPTDRAAVATLGRSERAAFIGRTYSHLFGAVVAFVLFEVALFRTSVPETFVSYLQGSPYTWLLFLGGFILLGSLASRTAAVTTSPGAQYAALFAYVALDALIFVPLLWIANRFAPGTIQSAALITLLGFAGLTAVAFLTRKDFSFLGGILGFVGVLALVAIVGAVVFGFTLGMWFSVAMVALAGASILYDTSNVLHRYPVDRHVAASLALFASVALMFWYVLRILMAMRE